MSTDAASTEATVRTDARPEREALLAGIPIREERLELAGLSTAVLVGGEGPPLVLLHGPGESAVNWRWTIPDLVRTHRVVAPDLPAHGGTEAPAAVDERTVLDWLEALVERTCSAAPVLVGHVLGGAIAARFAARRRTGLAGLVLVDSLGLGRFRPSLRFLLTLVGFQARPTEWTYEMFMGQCAYDRDALRDRMGGLWSRFVRYNLALARGPKAKAAGRMLRSLGLPRIPPEDLERIEAPTALIWGRHDRATSVEVARGASERYGWPLHVIEDAADDPPRDRPEAFVRTLRSIRTSGSPR
ncbi:MAG TPA: alpha/beta hydrolase [Gemmatimonadota bacterium]|nr:alpha/beta hydrolase [Gemmatimonadota bacterium]